MSAILRGAGKFAPDMEALRRARADFSKAVETEYNTLLAVVSPDTKVPEDKPEKTKKKPAPKKGDDGAAILEEEMANPSSRINWDRFKALKALPRAELDRAINEFYKRSDALDAIDALMKLFPTLKSMDTAHTVGYLWKSEARREYKLRKELVDQIAKVEAMLKAAGDCPAAALFASGQLTALRDNLRRDIDNLLDHHGEVITRAESSSSSSGSWGSFSWKTEPPKPKFDDPTPAEQLPARIALHRSDVATLEAILTAIGDTLKDPDLAAKITKASETAAERAPELVKLLGTYALLADEATHAVDYKRENPWHGPDRAYYRARMHTTKNERATDSQKMLKAELQRALEQPDPVAALEKAIMSNFMREISLPVQATRDWKPTIEAVTDAIEGEALLPLRYFNDMDRCWGYSSVWPEMKALFRLVSRSIVEGTIDELPYALPTADRQLAMLTPEGLEAWMKPLATESVIKDSKGNPVTLTTHEARGVERLWVTKNHTGSHGFDHPMGAPCLLAYLTNARTEAIIVDDPRWPQHAGRMYMRMLRLADGTPAMFVEGMAKDNEYPCQNEAEETLIKHAMQKAKAMGVQLIISGYAAETVTRMNLKGEWRNAEKVRFVLSPTPLIEATVAFGPHDWVHQYEAVRSPNKKAFVCQGE
jgi:hypothetical protein